MKVTPGHISFTQRPCRLLILKVSLRSLNLPPTVSQFLGGEPSAGDLGWKQEMGRYFAEWGPEWAADLGMLGGI